MQIRHGRKDILIAAFEPALIARIASDEPGAPEPELYEQPRLRDPRIEQLVSLLADEAQAGFPHGRLYGESLGIALAAHVVHRYCGVKMPLRRTGGMAPHRLHRVLDYIDAHLTEDLRLGALAAVAEQSTHRFAHNFKQATGLAPHQYVVRERVERAKRMLRESKATIAAIGQGCGFGSASRFALLFRRATGTTPSAFRASSR
jgi:AraC family transcriptional regulator